MKEEIEPVDRRNKINSGDKIPNIFTYLVFKFEASFLQCHFLFNYCYLINLPFKLNVLRTTERWFITHP